MHNLSVSYRNKTNKQSWIIESNISNHIVARYYVNYPPAKVCLYKCLLLRIADEAVTKKRMLQRGRHSGVSKHNPLIISALDYLLLYKALRKNGQHAKKKNSLLVFFSHIWIPSIFILIKYYCHHVVFQKQMLLGHATWSVVYCVQQVTAHFCFTTRTQSAVHVLLLYTSNLCLRSNKKPSSSLLM